MASSYTSSQSWTYDVFLSFRGHDTRNKFVVQLYHALEQRLIRTYNDDITIYPGEPIGPALLQAIEESRIAVIIFSRNYADSSWCLIELAHIMKCREERGQIVIPIFYDVKPFEVRKLKGKFGQGFMRHELGNNKKVKSWRKALMDAGSISEWEPKLILNGHNSFDIDQIVDTVSDKLISLTPYVGMETRLQDLKSRIKIGSGGVRMVGIYGVGGSGKTALVTSVYKELAPNFAHHCFVDNISEESNKINGLQNLQQKVLTTLMKKSEELKSVEEGENAIESTLCDKHVLIILDDVDDRKQLDALAGSQKWFGDGSRIVITSRKEDLLRNHKVDDASPVSLLSFEEAIQLFNRHASNKYNKLKDYEVLSLRVVSFAAGLPLALIVLGSYLYDKDKKAWMSTLARLGDIPENETLEMLKISYDGLEPLVKELFLDVACFFRGKNKDNAVQMLDACGFQPAEGVKVLINRALISIKGDKFYMHDLVQEMGLWIVQGDEDPTNPSKRSRVWLTEEIEDIYHQDATTNYDKIEAIQLSSSSSHVPNLVSNMKRLRFLHVPNDQPYVYNMAHKDVEGPNFLSNELCCINWFMYPASLLPDNFQPRMLVVLKLPQSLQEELWKGCKEMPSLKVLDVNGSKNLVKAPDFNGLPNLEVLLLCGCSSLIEIHPSIECHERISFLNLDGCCKLQKFPTFDKMKRLETLLLSRCPQLVKLPEIQQHMESLKYLYLDESGIEVLPSSIGKFCTKLTSINLIGCKNLKTIECNFTLFEQKCGISGGPRDVEEGCLSE